VNRLQRKVAVIVGAECNAPDAGYAVQLKKSLLQGFVPQRREGENGQDGRSCGGLSL